MALVFNLALGTTVALVTSCKPKQASPGPKATYMQFRSLLKDNHYPQAFALMDDAARQEMRAVATTVLGMAGVPSSKLKDVSDLKIFSAFMHNQKPHEFEITDEKIDDDTATLNCMITQGGRAQPVVIKMRRSGDSWLIHSTGVAFGE